MFQILDKNGNVQSKLEPRLSNEDLKEIYSLMLTTRAADLKALKLQRQGRMGTYGSSLGHEASQVGTAFPIRKKDWVFPHFRDLGMYVSLGFPIKNYYLYWMGNEIGSMTPPELNIFPHAIPVGSQIPQAVGAGMAANIKKDKIAIVCTFGDGATSEGDFHEALNFAGTYKTPNVFVCYNNQYAISMTREKQTASKTLAQKAEAYGFEGILVDGNDVLAMYTKVKIALAKARNGGGPTFIEAFTYRMSDHTTSDDASRYRSKEEVKEWEEKDPIKRYRIYLEEKKIWNDTFEKKIKEATEEKVNKAVEEAESTPLPSIEDLFTYTYKTMPPHLQEQLEELRASLKEK
jgi:pyruvate dehydrogenase E1 component alpha subunit